MEHTLPILTCEEAAALEDKFLLQADNAKTWHAMNQVGKSLGNAILQDFLEIGPLPMTPQVLVLIGKGHNGGDAILGATQISKVYPNTNINILFALGKEGLRSLTKQALETLPSFTEVSLKDALTKNFDICIDGIFGMSFRPPVKEPLISLINAINKHPHIKFRAAVDIPSGLLFKSDFTYTTGVPKTPLFDDTIQNLVGRIRFIDIGFFKEPYTGPHSSQQFLLQSSILDSLRELRPSVSDKRKYGHLFVISGSRNYPGALLMTVKAAVKSGIGLITVFTPESLVASFAPEIPEAIWVPFPETDAGTLALSGKHLVIENLHKATAILSGPGLGDNPETLELISQIAAEVPLPIAFDASALIPKTFESLKKRASNAGPIIATPHLGELKRISGPNTNLINWAKEYKVTTLLKGAISKIAHEGIIYNSTFGGPVLARGGSGDILSGLVGGLLAQNPDNPLETLSKALVWHGLAADALARNKGQVAVRTTDILDFLHIVLHN